VSGDLAAASSAITAACWPSGEVSGVGADVLAAFENASEALVAGAAAVEDVANSGVQLFRRRIGEDPNLRTAPFFGAGFGGSVWALVAADVAEQFLTRWRKAYAHDFPEHTSHAEFIVTRPGPGATRL